MNRNQEINFNSLPTIQYKRSKRKYRKNHKTTMNTGDLVPIYANELIQPGDTIRMDLSLVIRMSTPFQPVMDNCWLDTWAFAIAWLDIWKYTKPFWGENVNGAWVQTTEYQTPRIKIGADQPIIEQHSVLAYLGWRQNTNLSGLETGGGLTVNAYCLSYNEWFRDQNYIAPLEINEEGVTITYDQNDTTKGGKLQRVAKLHDRFTTPLPEPQKGASPTLPLGTTAPVYFSGAVAQTMPLTGMELYNASDGTPVTGVLNGGNDGYVNTVVGVGYGGHAAYAMNLHADHGAADSVRNLAIRGYADLTEAVGATLAATRISVAINQIEEAMGIYGSRYREIIKSQWGVTTNDMMMHIPEYLGGKRTPINVEQVTVTSDQGAGATGAMSLTNDYYKMFTKSFQEHSVLLVLAAIRTDQSYGQGLARQYWKNQKYTYYWNKLAGLSFQPVYVGEIFTTGDMTENTKAFGFLPPWDEYRSEVNMLTGYFQPDNPKWLGEWTYGNKFQNRPVMGQQFIEETLENVDRTLEASHEVTDQFICDFEFFITKVSEVPQFGVPGLTKF